MLGGGNVIRMGSQNTYVYAVQKRSIMLRLAHALNGYIRNSLGLPQLTQAGTAEFQKICKVLGVRFQKPFPLTGGSAYHGGFFDTDGHISAYISGRGIPPPSSSSSI